MSLLLLLYYYYCYGVGVVVVEVKDSFTLSETNMESEICTVCTEGKGKKEASSSYYSTTTTSSSPQCRRGYKGIGPN